MLSLAIDPNPSEINVPFNITIRDFPAGTDYYVDINVGSCTVYGTYCQDSRDGIADIKHHLMINNGDGTFSYVHTPIFTSNYTILIKKYEAQGISAYYFQSFGTSGEPYSTEIISDINFDIPSGELFPGCSGPCMLVYEFMLIAPISGTVTILLGGMSGALLNLDNNVIRSNGIEATPYDLTMEAGELYYGHLLYGVYNQHAKLSLSWKYPNQVEQIIPPSAFLHPSPVQHSTVLPVNCPAGKFKENLN